MIIIYFSILMFLGYLASKRIRNMKDFVIGGKSLSFWVAAFSAQATGESAWLLLGLTGMGAMVGKMAGIERAMKGCHARHVPDTDGLDEH